MAIEMTKCLLKIPNLIFLFLRKVSGNAAYSKRIQKTVAQKKLRLSIDNQVIFYCLVDKTFSYLF